MVTDNSPVARARPSIKFYLERLRAQAANLSAQDYPGNLAGPRHWLALVGGLLDTADHFLTLSNSPDASDPEDLATEAASLASLAYECLDLMRGASIEDLPFPVVRPLQRWFDQLHINTTTFFRSEAIANYELRRIKEDVFKDIHLPTDSLSLAITRITWPLLRVTVPSKALGILPHFAIVAHEIRHALYERLQLTLPTFESEQSALKSRIAARLAVNHLSDRTIRYMQETFYYWLEEFAADALGLLLAGPAFFFSLADFLQLEGRGLGLSQTHPPHSLRRGVLFQRLSSGKDSFASVFLRRTGIELREDFNSPLLVKMLTTDDVFNYLKGYDEELAAVLAELPGIFERLHQKIYDASVSYLKKEAPEAIYTVHRYEEDIQTHLEPLLAAVPPIERGLELECRTPTEFASILNVGWIVVLTSLKDLRVKTSEDPLQAEKLDRLHGLLLKAVELAEARRDWEMARGGHVRS